MNPEAKIGLRDAAHYDELAALRRDAPVHEYETGRFTIARYAEVREISRDPARFCSARGVLVNDPMRASGQPAAGSILHMDPPQHAPWRQVVSRRFTPRAVATYEPIVRRLARGVLDAAADGAGAEIDFVDRVAAPFPLYVIAALLGVPQADYEQFRRWSDATIESPDRPGEGLDDMAALYRFLVDLVHERRANPSDDLVSVIVGTEVEGALMNTPAAVMYVLTLLIAGNETTRHLVSGSVRALFEHPEQRALLGREPERMANAVEELLRWVTPITTFTRTATVETELAGVPIAAGDIMTLLYTSANRDEDAFGDTAGRFDVTRRFDSAHLAFGFGEHLCLGAALARLEARVLLEELLTRYPEYEVAGAPEYVPSTLVHGMARLPVVLA